MAAMFASRYGPPPPLELGAPLRKEMLADLLRMSAAMYVYLAQSGEDIAAQPPLRPAPAAWIILIAYVKTWFACAALGYFFPHMVHSRHCDSMTSSVVGVATVSYVDVLGGVSVFLVASRLPNALLWFGFRIDRCARPSAPRAPTPIPRARDMVVRTRPVQKAIEKRPRRKRKAPEQYAEEAKPTPSIRDLLTKRKPTTLPSTTEDDLPTSDPKDPILEANLYIEQVKRDVMAGHIDMRGNPWVAPGNTLAEAEAINAQRRMDKEQLVDPTEAWNLVLRPTMFVWAPEKIFPDFKFTCRTCGHPTAQSGWGRPRVLHYMDNQFVYVATRHACENCASGQARKAAQVKKSGSAQKATRVRERFMADAKEMLTRMPGNKACLWDFVDTGRTICDASVADFVRAMATRVSWKAMSEIVTELKETKWMRSVVQRYLLLCDSLQIVPISFRTCFPPQYVLRDDWLRDLFVRDAHDRKDEVVYELNKEIGDDVLVLDWTKDAAKRCNGNFLFNAMSGAGIVLASEITDTSGPSEVEPVMQKLKSQGVCPKVVYVDDGCCGAWKTCADNLWPGVHVRLDAWHAIRRLTQTTTSTQHPWHGRFCAELSNAVYVYDQQEVGRLRRARVREGLTWNVPNTTRNKYIPRIVTDPPKIIARVAAVLTAFDGRHEEMGELLTARTQHAWAALKTHVENGCLCDPPGMNMHTFGEPTMIGDEEFQTIRTKRGASALEGFHTHQKQWLGMFAQHSTEAGKALLADGALRWNRRRRNEATQETATVPLVFASNLLQATDRLHKRLSGEGLFPGLAYAMGRETASVETTSRSTASSSSSSGTTAPTTPGSSHTPTHSQKRHIASATNTLYMWCIFDIVCPIQSMQTLTCIPRYVLNH